jgi:hypothetical protein
MNRQARLYSMRGIYRSNPANDIVEFGKRVEQQRYSIISAVDSGCNTLDGRAKGLHIRDGGTGDIAGFLHSGER